MGLGEALAAVGAKIGEGSQYYRADGTVVGSVVTTELEWLERHVWHA